MTKELPEEFNLGLVTFNNVAESIVAPTTDRNQIYAAIQGLKVHGSTAMGDGLELGLQTARTPISDSDGKARRLPAAHRAAVRRQERARQGAGRDRRPGEEAQGPDLHDRARHAVGRR